MAKLELELSITCFIQCDGCIEQNGMKSHSIVIDNETIYKIKAISKLTEERETTNTYIYHPIHRF